MSLFKVKKLYNFVAIDAIQDIVHIVLELRTGRVGSGQPINPIRNFFSGRVGPGQSGQSGQIG